MKIDILVAEIGSTTTVVNGFNIDENPIFVGSGQSATTVEDGDVRIGLSEAIEDFRRSMSWARLDYKELIATSSAAGGLKMTVHGLVYDMTVKAAKEAALGAGANIHMVTAGKLRRTDLAKIKEIQPNIMLLAGGVDFGERDTALYNAEKLADLNLNIPIIYAGNCQNQEEVQLIFEESNSQLYIVENVYPRIDQLNVEPTRAVIQDVFEEHIIHAPGMEHVKDMVNGNIIPTPAGVMEATKAIHESLGDVITIDVGGATTDIHSVTEGNEDIARMMIAPEPIAKRTVEGDLGVFINMLNIVELETKEAICKAMKIESETLERLIAEHKAIPKTDMERQFVEVLTEVACKVALERHAGTLIELFSTAGKKRVAQGKDLTAVKYVIGTGGALTRLPNRVGILENMLNMTSGLKLLPSPSTQILIDNQYIMASLGVLYKRYPEASVDLLKQTIEIGS